MSDDLLAGIAESHEQLRLALRRQHPEMIGPREWIQLRDDVLRVLEIDRGHMRLLQELNDRRSEMIWELLRGRRDTRRTFATVDYDGRQPDQATGLVRGDEGGRGA